MISINNLQAKHLKDLCEQYSLWIKIYEESVDPRALDMVKFTIDSVNNFDDSYVSMIEHETKEFLNLILTRIRKFQNPFNDSDRYTKLLFDKDDVIVASFINHAKFVRGYVTENKILNFIEAVKKQLVSVDKKSDYIEQMINEAKEKMKLVDIKTKVKKA